MFEALDLYPCRGHFRRLIGIGARVRPDKVETHGVGGAAKRHHA